jgi:transcriptional regulator with XRE-family HTH domain
MRRRRLTRVLRTYREAAGMSADTAADELLCGAGTISRMENGQSADPLRVKAALELYGAPPEVIADMIKIAKESRKRGAIRRPYHDFDIPKRLADYYELEDEAETASLLEGEFVPGLVQTPDYARALIAGYSPHVRPDEVDQLVEIRMARQRRLAAPDPLKLRIAIGEAALLTEVGGPTVLRSQLKQLTRVANETSNIEIRILPFSAGGRPALGRNFTILTFPDPADPDVIFAESVSYFVLEDEAAEVKTFQDAYTQLWDTALDESNSARRLAQAASEINK